jgi:hypothetical protein
VDSTYGGVNGERPWLGTPAGTRTLETAATIAQPTFIGGSLEWLFDGQPESAQL